MKTQHVKTQNNNPEENGYSNGVSETRQLGRPKLDKQTEDYQN